MYCLKKGSSPKVAFTRKDANTAIKYSVAEEEIDLKELRIEKKRLEEELALKEPTNKELIEEGMLSHPFYFKDEERLQKDLNRIKAILEKV